MFSYGTSTPCTHDNWTEASSANHSSWAEVLSGVTCHEMDEAYVFHAYIDKLLYSGLNQAGSTELIETAATDYLCKHALDSTSTTSTENDMR